MGLDLEGPAGPDGKTTSVPEQVRLIWLVTSEPVDVQEGLLSDFWFRLACRSERPTRHFMQNPVPWLKPPRQPSIRIPHVAQISSSRAVFMQQVASLLQYLSCVLKLVSIYLLGAC